MFKKLKWRVITQTASFLSILCLGFIFLIISANCNESSKKDGQSDSSSASTASEQASGSDRLLPRINWLQDILRHRWDTMAFNIPDDSAEIERVKRNARIYVRGWLAEYNAVIKAIKSDTTQYIVDSFYFERKPGAGPLRFKIKAFLYPEAEHGHHHPGDQSSSPGVHLIPPEPDPPGGFQ